MQNTQEAVPFRYLTKAQRDTVREFVSNALRIATVTGQDTVFDRFAEWSWVFVNGAPHPFACIGVASGPQQEPDA